MGWMQPWPSPCVHVTAAVVLSCSLRELLALKARRQHWSCQAQDWWNSGTRHTCILCISRKPHCTTSLWAEELCLFHDCHVLWNVLCGFTVDSAVYETINPKLSQGGIYQALMWNCSRSFQKFIYVFRKRNKLKNTDMKGAHHEPQTQHDPHFQSFKKVWPKYIWEIECIKLRICFYLIPIAKVSYIWSYFLSLCVQIFFLFH